MAVSIWAALALSAFCSLLVKSSSGSTVAFSSIPAAVTVPAALMAADFSFFFVSVCFEVSIPKVYHLPCKIQENGLKTAKRLHFPFPPNR